MRSDSLTSRLSVTSPTPSMLGARVCMATQSRLRRASSKTSSQVMIRWPAGMAPHRARSMVVLPDWVAPETRMLSPAWTEASRKAAPAHELAYLRVEQRGSIHGRKTSWE